MSEDHPLFSTLKSVHDKIEKQTGKCIKDTVATLLYGPYLDRDDGSIDNYNLSFYNPEHPENRREFWPQNFDDMVEILRRELKPEPKP